MMSESELYKNLGVNSNIHNLQSNWASTVDGGSPHGNFYFPDDLKFCSEDFSQLQQSESHPDPIFLDDEDLFALNSQEVKEFGKQNVIFGGKMVSGMAQQEEHITGSNNNSGTQDLMDLDLGITSQDFSASQLSDYSIVGDLLKDIMETPDQGQMASQEPVVANVEIVHNPPPELPFILDNASAISNESICLENYLGDYNFDVIPSPASENNKLRYHSGTRKLFCKVGTYEFNINLDFGKIANPGRMTVRAVMVFTDPEHQEKTVTKCLSCINAEYAETPVPEREEYAHYILRAPQKDNYVQYIKSSETDRVYLLVPMKTPEPGYDCMRQNFNFSCLTSCKYPGINRRHSSIIFTLLDERYAVRGRSVISLKVCSNPPRDFEIEYCKERKSNSTKKSKQTPQKSPSVKNASLKRVSIKKEPASPPKRSLPGTSNVRSTVNDEDAMLDNGNCSQEKSSSQESVFSDIEDESGSSNAVRLRRLYRDSRVVLKMKHSKTPSRRMMAHTLFTTLKAAQAICVMARKEINEEKKNQPASQQD